LRVPPNSDSGRKLRLKGRGLPGPQAGDQYVILEVHAPEAGGEHERAAYEQFAQAFRGFNPRQGF
jgi:curved DNA-binding protein